MNDRPDAWTEAELKGKSFAELRERLTTYADLAEEYETGYATAQSEFTAREAVYVKIFAKLAVLDEARDVLFELRPGDSTLADSADLVDAIAVTTGFVAAGLGLKSVMLLKKLYDIRQAWGVVTVTQGVIGRTGSAASLKVNALKNAKAIKSIRMKAGLFAAVSVGFAGYTLWQAKRSEAAARTEIEQALPDYEAWFDEIEEAVALFNGAIQAINEEISALVASTSSGTEDRLLEYLDAAISDVGTFQALYDSVVTMLEDGVTVDKVVTYTGLPKDYVEQIQQQI